MSSRVRRPPERIVCALLCLGVLAIPGATRAHVGHVIARAERYIKLDIGGRDARVVVSLSLGRDVGRGVLQTADSDGDGEVSAEESERYLEEWAAGLADELPVRVDGRAVPLAWRDGFFEPIGEVRATPATLELVGHFRLTGGEQTVRIEDAMVRREVFERTDVRFQCRDGAELIASGLEEEPTVPQIDLAYTPFADPSSAPPLVARVRTPVPDGPAWPIIGLIFGALLAAAIALSRREIARASK